MAKDMRHTDFYQIFHYFLFYNFKVGEELIEIANKLVSTEYDELNNEFRDFNTALFNVLLFDD